MIRLKLVMLFFAFHISATVFGQQYPKDMLSHKVIVNHDDRTIVAYTKPFKPRSALSDRQYYWFKQHAIGSTQGGYSGKLLNGSYQEFYANKQLSEAGNMSKGLKHGVWKLWNPNGKLLRDDTWDNGTKTGLYHKYDSLGRAVESGFYKNNLLNGKQVILHGDSIKNVRYRNGQLVVPKKQKPGYIKRVFNKIKPKFL